MLQLEAPALCGKGWIMMNQQKCLLCGQEYPTGLHVMGCLICFPCEKRLLSAPVAELPRRGKRRRLLRLYTGAAAQQ